MTVTLAPISTRSTLLPPHHALLRSPSEPFPLFHPSPLPSPLGPAHLTLFIPLFYLALAPPSTFPILLFLPLPFIYPSPSYEKILTEITLRPPATEASSPRVTTTVSKGSAPSPSPQSSDSVTSPGQSSRVFVKKSGMRKNRGICAFFVIPNHSIERSLWSNPTL